MFKLNTLCMVIVQFSTHSSISHYSAVVFWLGIIHIPISLTLIISVNGLSQLNIGCLGKRGFELIGLASRIGIVRQYCCSLSYFLCTLSVLLVLIAVCSYSNSDTSLAVNRCNCTTTHTSSQVQTMHKQQLYIMHTRKRHFSLIQVFFKLFAICNVVNRCSLHA